MARCRQGHAPCETSNAKNSSKSWQSIIVGRQLCQTLELTVHAYHKKEGASLQPGACKLSLQYDGRPDESFGCGLGRGILVV